MYSWKEKTDHHEEDVLELFRMLESSDSDSVDSVKRVIHENLSTTKDSKLLYALVDYYMAVQSKRALDILLRVKEPHDKHLFDKLVEHMKSSGAQRYQSLQLLSNLVYKQPSWLYKIAHHRIMNTLLHLLKCDIEPVNLMSELFIIISLLPMIPSQFGPYLIPIFEVFSRLAAWSIKKPNPMPEIYVLHLEIGVYSLFHRLYGMFPCNFLAYLRSYYGGRDFSEENLRVFTLVIKPMLERVRLHPLLVTASKETELSPKRWKKMATHDIVVECAAISLDAIEGNVGSIGGGMSSVFGSHGYQYFQDSIQHVSCSSQSSTTSANIEPGSLAEISGSSQEKIWSPLHACGVSTPSQFPASVATKGDGEQRKSSNDEKLALDLGVEAKPDDVSPAPSKSAKSSRDAKPNENDAGLSSKDGPKHENILSKHGGDNEDKSKEATCSFEASTARTDEIVQAIEAKEEGDLDKEVCELTNTSHAFQPDEVRYSTPFCSTTQNLTAEPMTHEDSLTKSSEDADEAYPSIPDVVDTFTCTLERFRYFSHCGPPPDIPSETSQKQKAARSMSCPEIHCIVPERSEDADASDSTKAETQQNISSSVVADTKFSSGDHANTWKNDYEELIPAALEPLPDPRQKEVKKVEAKQIPTVVRLSPAELLDRHIQLGGETYINQLSAIPITSTKSTHWTHFGGKPPPDEIAILRNQVVLLHNQLLFERHRKEIHGERNRRILGRAKKSRMQEELTAALKDQVSLLEKENQDLKGEIAHQSKLYKQLRNEKQQMENDYNARILKIYQEKDHLSYSNEKLKGLLVSKQQENDEIKEELKKCQSQLFDAGVELEHCSQEVSRCQKLEREAVWMSKQLVLLQELNSHYKEKLDLLKEPPTPEIGLDLLKEAALIEISDLKQKLEAKTSLLDVSRAKIAELEVHLSNMKLKQKEHAQIIENLKSFQKDELHARDDRLHDLKKICIQKEGHIMELYQREEFLKETICKLEQKLGAPRMQRARSSTNSNSLGDGPPEA